jgi:hypothetical protein
VSFKNERKQLDFFDETPFELFFPFHKRGIKEGRRRLSTSTFQLL